MVPPSCGKSTAVFVALEPSSQEKLGPSVRCAASEWSASQPTILVAIVGAVVIVVVVRMLKKA